MLIFANKTRADIILENELICVLGGAFISILSDEKAEGYSHGYITEEFLKATVPERIKNYYVCGPPPMMDNVLTQLAHLGVSDSSIIMEAV